MRSLRMWQCLTVCLLLGAVMESGSVPIETPPNISQFKDICPQESVLATNGKEAVCFWCGPYCYNRTSEDCRKVCPEFLQKYGPGHNNGAAPTAIPPISADAITPTVDTNTTPKSKKSKNKSSDTIDFTALIALLAFIAGILIGTIAVLGSQKFRRRRRKLRKLNSSKKSTASNCKVSNPNSNASASHSLLADGPTSPPPLDKAEKADGTREPQKDTTRVTTAMTDSNQGTQPVRPTQEVRTRPIPMSVPDESCLTLDSQRPGTATHEETQQPVEDDEGSHLNQLANLPSVHNNRKCLLLYRGSSYNDLKLVTP